MGLAKLKTLRQRCSENFRCRGLVVLMARFLGGLGTRTGIGQSSALQQSVLCRLVSTSKRGIVCSPPAWQQSFYSRWSVSDSPVKIVMHIRGHTRIVFQCSSVVQRSIIFYCGSRVMHDLVAISKLYYYPL